MPADIPAREHHCIKAELMKPGTEVIITLSDEDARAIGLEKGVDDFAIVQEQHPGGHLYRIGSENISIPDRLGEVQILSE